MGLKELWQVVREDDNGLVYLMVGNLSEQDARARAKKLDTANKAKPHPHKQSYYAEPKQPRLTP